MPRQERPRRRRRRKRIWLGCIRRSSRGVPLIFLNKDFLRFKHRFRDSGVGAASAEIAAHALANAFWIISCLPLLNEADRAHDLARRAESALETVVRDEGGLNGMEAVALGDSLDRKQLGAVVAQRQSQAGINPLSIGQDRAGAALTAIAALFCSS